MIDLKQQEKRFEKHIATFTDYGNIKILDFKNPDSSEYRIRFLFEEDYCRLHISGDLGELTATNFNNMRYDKFSDFVDNTGYFEEKIDCHRRALYFYDEDKAREYIRQLIEEADLADEICDGYEYETVGDFIEETLEDFDDDHGIKSKGVEKLSEYLPNIWECAGEIGRERTGILELYMLAFKLAQKSLKKQDGEGK